PADSLAHLKTPDDLTVDLVLSEPAIGQPLSMKWDSRGRLWVVNYLQYPSPAGLKMVSRDKFLRSVYDQVPPAPPNHFRGADKITFHEDTDGDGKYDKHGTFIEGLSLCTSFEFGRGGVWVLQPPYLLFYPDANRDDVPDGDPVVHLEGFGLEDSHSVTNNLRFGPDGWLYATQGSTVTGNIKRPGDKTAVYSEAMASAPSQRFTHTFILYDGGALPEQYNGRLFGVQPLGSHVVMSDVLPDRSSFKTKDIGHALDSTDPWFRPVDIQVGPDGGVYVADMYEQRIDHASDYQGRIHKESGRIYRIRGKGTGDRGQGTGGKRLDLSEETA